MAHLPAWNTEHAINRFAYTPLMELVNRTRNGPHTVALYTAPAVSDKAPLDQPATILYLEDRRAGSDAVCRIYTGGGQYIDLDAERFDADTANLCKACVPEELVNTFLSNVHETQSGHIEKWMFCGEEMFFVEVSPGGAK